MNKNHRWSNDRIGNDNEQKQWQKFTSGESESHTKRDRAANSVFSRFH